MLKDSKLQQVLKKIHFVHWGAAMSLLLVDFLSRKASGLIDRCNTLLT